MEHQLQLVGEICRQLDGIPLAIELAAPLVSALSLEQIVDHLEDRFALLGSGTREALPRHRTLRAMVDWSYGLLAEAERRLFERLSVFAGGWTLEAAERVCAGGDLREQEVLQLLVRLVDQSLVIAEPGGTEDRQQRYRLLETLRQFALARLDERGEAVVTQERHAAFFLELFEKAEQEFLQRFATAGVVSRMDSELGNLRVALRWLIGQAEVDRAQRLAGAARILWLQRGYLAEGQRWLDEALALDIAQRAPIAPAARARALLGMIGAAWLQGDLAVAQDAGLSSLQLFQELHDTGRAAGALRFLAQVTYARADFVGARGLLEEAVTATRETGQLAGLAINLCDLAELDLEEGDLVKAPRHAEEAMKAATADGHPAIGCRAMTTLAAVQWRLGRLDESRRTREQVLTRIREAHRQDMVIVPALINLGRFALESVAARACLIEGLQLARDRDRWGLTHGLEVVVQIAAAEGQAEFALHVAGAATALRDRMGTPPWPSEQARLSAAITTARRSLTTDAADVAWACGLTNPVDQTLAMALDFLRQLSAESVREGSHEATQHAEVSASER